MIDYFKYFFNPRHLFSLRPPAMQLRAVIILAIVFGLFIILGIVSKIIAIKTKDGLKAKAWRRGWYLGITMGIIGFVYLFFAWQGVALLAGRFWLIAWLIAAVVWFSFIIKYLFLEVPKLRKNIQHKREFEKYIP
jgi:hypothetical protein